MGYKELSAQNELSATILANDTNESLRYCIVSSKNKNKTYLTNPEGFFHIPFISDNDTLEISLLGYVPLKKKVSDIRIDNKIFLEGLKTQSRDLSNTISPSDLNSYFRSAAEKLKKRPAIKSRAYLQYSTYAGSNDYEFSRFYYNTLIQGSKVLDMNLKQGRFGLLNNQLGINVLGPSKTLIKSSPIQNSKLFPSNPLQLIFDKEGENRWKFEIGKYSDSSDIIHVFFTPLVGNEGNLYAGELWMDTISFNIVKLSLKTNDAKVHPFQSSPGDSIGNVSIGINYHFANISETANNLILIDYSYSFDYTKNKVVSTFSERIMNEGLVHFYNYDDVFFIPTLISGSFYDDHLKSAMMPFDSMFWKYNRGTDLTIRQLERISNISKKWSFSKL